MLYWLCPHVFILYGLSIKEYAVITIFSLFYISFFFLNTVFHFILHITHFHSYTSHDLINIKKTIQVNIILHKLKYLISFF